MTQTAANAALLESLCDLEEYFTRLQAQWGDGDLVLGLFPIAEEVPVEPCRLQFLGNLGDCFPYTTGSFVYGAGGFWAPDGRLHEAMFVFAASGEKAKPAMAHFLHAAGMAGAFCQRLPDSAAVGGVGHAPEFEWLVTLYTNLKGAPFVVEREGHSQIASLFAASVRVLRNLRQWLETGVPLNRAQDLSLGIPGSEPRTFRVVRRLTNEEYAERRRRKAEPAVPSMPVSEQPTAPTTDPEEKALADLLLHVDHARFQAVLRLMWDGTKRTHDELYSAAKYTMPYAKKHREKVDKMMKRLRTKLEGAAPAVNRLYTLRENGGDGWILSKPRVPSQNAA